MSNKLQVWLKKVNEINFVTESEPSILIKDTINMTSIIDVLINEGKVSEKDQVIRIINQFNQKAAELVAAGNIVDTGLVKMKAKINGRFYNNKWNPSINKITAKVEQSTELIVTFANTFVEIVEECTDKDKKAASTEGTPRRVNHVPKSSNIRVSNPLFSQDEIPACGLAFRQWLLNS